MDRISALFDQMDRWRHLPSYQLERRADLLFSLYLPEALESLLHPKRVRPHIIPEFPIKQLKSSRSYKIDYLALTSDSDEAIFVELKTDKASLRAEQFEYLLNAAQAGMPRILADLDQIYAATREKPKYRVLIQALQDVGLDMNSDGQLPQTCRVVLIQPQAMLDESVSDMFRDKGVTLDVISFDDFHTHVAGHGDPLSLRFAQSLKKWAAERPGHPEH